MQLKRLLAQLRGWREYAFVLALAQRSAPNYQIFAKAVGLPRPEDATAVLDDAWHMLAQRDHDVNINRLLARLDRLMLDPAAYDVYGVNPAYDHLQLLELALLCRVNPDKRRAETAGEIALNSVLQFVEMRDGEGMDDDALVRHFEQDELVKIERHFQRALAEDLRKQRAPEDAFVQQLRDAADNDGVSNLGISAD